MSDVEINAKEVINDLATQLASALRDCAIYRAQIKALQSAPVQPAAE